MSNPLIELTTLNESSRKDVLEDALKNLNGDATNIQNTLQNFLSLVQSRSSTQNTTTLRKRIASISRKTKETQISVDLDLDGGGESIQIDTGIGFLNHMFEAFAKHARFNLKLKCVGDLHIDDHHTAEDCAIVLGQAVDQALGDRKGLVRFGSAHAPLDEALSMAVVDVSSRPFGVINLGLKRDMIGQLSCEMLTHVLHSFITSARLTVHIQCLAGDNDHHRAESAFKALACAFRTATTVEPSRLHIIPSTKEML